MKLKSFLYTLMAVATVLMVSCQPDEISMGKTSIKPENLAEGISYEITHDTENPNIVYLKNLMSSQYQALWEHPQGRSQENEVTLKMPFAGEYEVTFGVMTSAGPVYASEPATFTIDAFCEDFVSDDRWTYLSGGVGNSKKWVIDLDENGLSRYFAGPITFYGTEDTWATVTGGTVGTDGDKDSWNWDASFNDVAGWQWTTELMDYGYMEFDLNNGSHVHVVSNDLGYDQTGTYMLNVDDPDENYTITFTDVQMFHDSMNDGQVESWTGEMKLLSLTENTMQIGVVRISDPCILSFNFISEEYRDTWTPGTNINIDLPDDWRDYVEPKTSLEMTYKLDDEKAYDWFDLDGNSLGLYGGQNYEAEDLTLVLYSGDNTYTVTTPDGDEYTGSYELNDNGQYTFSNALPSVDLTDDGSAYFESDKDNTLQILAIELDDYTGGLSEMWLGKKEYDDQGNLVQILGYHFIVQVGETELKFKVDLEYFDTGWTFQNTTTYITEEGTYTLTIEGASGDSPYGVYLDIYKILKTYPNCDIVIESIKIDGTTEILKSDDTTGYYITDAIIDRGEGDVSTTARRYILNPWGATADSANEFVFETSLSVTFEVIFDNETPFVPASSDGE